MAAHSFKLIILPPLSLVEPSVRSTKCDTKLFLVKHKIKNYLACKVICGNFM